MNRIEVNVTTGERRVIELTPEEVAEAQARSAAEAAKIMAKPETVADLKAALIAKGLITDADVKAAAT
jgi:hypothetical protein